MGRVLAVALDLERVVIELRAEQLELQVEHRLEQARLHEAALTRAEATHQQCGHALRDVAAEQVVGDRQADGDGPIRLRATQPGQPRDGLREQVLTWAIAPRTLGAVAGGTRVDDRGVDRLDRLVVQPDPLHDAGAEVLDEDVGMGDQLSDVGKVGGHLEVGRDGLLVAVHRVERDRVAVQHAAGERQGASDVAGARTLDLDDARTEVGESHRRDGAGQELAEVQHEQPVEGSDVPFRHRARVTFSGSQSGMINRLLMLLEVLPPRKEDGNGSWCTMDRDRFI